MPDFKFDEPKKRTKTGESRFLELTEEVLGRERVEIIGHAQERMGDWDLTDEDALKVLRQPDLVDLPTDVGRKRYRRHKTNRVSVDVVFEEFPDTIRIITVIKVERRMTRRGRK